MIGVLRLEEMVQYSQFLIYPHIHTDTILFHCQSPTVFVNSITPDYSFTVVSTVKSAAHETLFIVTSYYVDIRYTSLLWALL